MDELLLERFARYSMDRERPIRLMWLTGDGILMQSLATVLRCDADVLEVRQTRPKKTIIIPRETILAADYKKGDEGQDE